RAAPARAGCRDTARTAPRRARRPGRAAARRAPSAGGAARCSRARRGAVSCGEALHFPARRFHGHAGFGMKKHAIGYFTADAMALALEQLGPFPASVMDRLP